jgi:hypothetical protein
MRALVLFAATGCVTGLQPRAGELVSTATPFTARSQLGTFSLGEELSQGHVVLVFYRGHW